MTSKRSRFQTTAMSQAVDDFELIKGIGPAYARRLHTAGIRTYTQLASLSPAKVAALVAGPSAGQIARQDWIGQAHQLASQQRPAKRHTKEAAPPDGLRLHSENFTVELVLYKDNHVHHTNVEHLPRRGKDNWDGWQVTRLTDFFVRHARLRLLPTELAPSVATTAGPAAFTAITNLTGTLRLRKAEIVPVDAGSPTEAVRVGRPFNVLITLELSDVIAPSDATLAYTVFLYAKTLGRGTRQIAGEVHGVLVNSDMITVQVRGTALAQGLYLLKVIVTLMLKSVEPPAVPDLIAIEEVGLLQIY